MSNSKKIVLVGHFGVGKTSLIRQFVESVFSEDYIVTLGVHVKKKVVSVNDQDITLIIWDIEGNTSLQKIRSSYLLGTSGFIYVFDVSRPETYENLSEEMAFLTQNYPKLPIVTVGNKIDLITASTHKEYFNTEGFANVLFTSAKNNQNVEELFLTMASKLVSE